MRFYVYTLSDPRDGTIFYVGKGLGDRAWVHTQEVKRGTVSNAAKSQRIADILEYDLEPIVRIVRKFENELHALDYEAHLIATLRGLTNIRLRGAIAGTRDEIAHSRHRIAEGDTKADQAKHERILVWLANWLRYVDTWPNGATMYGVIDGDAKAEEFVALVRKHVKLGIEEVRDRWANAAKPQT